MHLCADELRVLILAVPFIGYCVQCVLVKLKGRA